MAKIEVPQNNSSLDALLSVPRAIIGGCPLEVVGLEAGIWRLFVIGFGFTSVGSDLAIHICAVG